MALKVNDVITRDFVRETVEEIVAEDLVWRQAFREIDATGIGSNAYTFFVDNDDMGTPEVIGEGEEFPRDKSTLREITVNFEKFGDEVAITMEAQEDGMIDMKARQVEDLARRMAQWLNQQAFEQLNADGNHIEETATGDAIGDGNGELTFSDIRDGMVGVRSYNYTPDLLIVDLDGYGDLLTDDNFNRATSGGDEVVRSGEIGRIAGMDVVVDNTQRIGTGGDGDDPTDAGAYVIDSSYYGYELTRTPITTNEYNDPERQAEIMQIYTRKAWATIWPEAAAKVDA